MASTSLQCAPLQLLGRGREGCFFGGAAVDSPHCNSHATAVAANLHRTVSDGCEKAFLGGGLRTSMSRSPSLSSIHRTSSDGCEKAFLGGGASLSRSSSLGNLTQRGSDALRYSETERRINPARALPVQALGVQVAEVIEKLPTNVE